MQQRSKGETVSALKRPPAQAAYFDGRPDLTPQEAAERLGLTPRGLRQWRTRNNGPAYYRGLGKQILYRQSDLDRFIESCRIDPNNRADRGCVN